MSQNYVASKAVVIDKGGGERERLSISMSIVYIVRLKDLYTETLVLMSLCTFIQLKIPVYQTAVLFRSSKISLSILTLSIPSFSRATPWKLRMGVSATEAVVGDEGWNSAGGSIQCKPIRQREKRNWYQWQALHAIQAQQLCDKRHLERISSFAIHLSTMAESIVRDCISSNPEPKSPFIRS